MLQALGESPVEEEHVYLKDQINDQCEDEDHKERMPSWVTDRVRHRCSGGIARLGNGTPHLTAILAFPNDVPVVSVELNDHDDGAYGGDDNEEWPAELAYPGPDV